MDGIIQERLFTMQDLTYQRFQCRLMPTVAPDTVIGVRTPQLRAFAGELLSTAQAEEFLHSLPHRYYEENNLHAFLIECISEFDACIAALDEFLPFVDNWATCDSMTPKVFKKHLLELREKIREWMASDHPYTVRYGIGMLLKFYLDDAFREQDLQEVAAIRSQEYYINMMIAWYFATALAKQYDIVLPYLQQRRLAPWVHNKTIQKSVESYRITPEQKIYLKTLKQEKRNETK